MALHVYSKGDTVYLPSADRVTKHKVTQVGIRQVRLSGAGWRYHGDIYAAREGAEAKQRELAAARREEEEHLRVRSERAEEARVLRKHVDGISFALYKYPDDPGGMRAAMRDKARNLLAALDALAVGDAP